MSEQKAILTQVRKGAVIYWGCSLCKENIGILPDGEPKPLERFAEHVKTKHQETLESREDFS